MLTKGPMRREGAAPACCQSCRASFFLQKFRPSPFDTACYDLFVACLQALCFCPKGQESSTNDVPILEPMVLSDFNGTKSTTSEKNSLPGFLLKFVQ